MATVSDVMAMIDDLSLEDRKELADFLFRSVTGTMALGAMLGRKSMDEMGEISMTMMPSILSSVGYQNFKRYEALHTERERIKRAVKEDGVGDGS